MSKQTFVTWLSAVDDVISERCGLSLDDLPDANTWDAWDAGEDPAEFAAEILAAEGLDDG